MLYPTASAEGFQPRPTVCCTAAIPVPVIDCPEGEFDALLENDKEADVLPLDCGVKVTVKDADCPAEIFAGSEIPETANSLLLRLADVTVIAVPVAVKLPFSDELDPTATLPKLRLAGDTANWPAAVPVPESAIVEWRVRGVRNHRQAAARTTGTGRREGHSKRHASICL